MRERSSCCLRGGRCARGDLRKDRACVRDSFIQQSQRINWLENSNPQGSFRLDGYLVAEMAVRAMRVIRGIGMVPVADDHFSKDQPPYERQGYPKNANSSA